jgi:hypothetical protein
MFDANVQSHPVNLIESFDEENIEIIEISICKQDEENKGAAEAAEKTEALAPVKQQEIAPLNLHWEKSWTPPTTSTIVPLEIIMSPAPPLSYSHSCQEQSQPLSRPALQMAFLQREREKLFGTQLETQYSSSYTSYKMSSKPLYQSVAHRITATRPIAGGTLRGSASAYKKRTATIPRQMRAPRLVIKISAYDEDEEM